MNSLMTRKNTPWGPKLGSYQGTGRGYETTLPFPPCWMKKDSQDRNVEASGRTSNLPPKKRGEEAPSWKAELSRHRKKWSSNKAISVSRLIDTILNLTAGNKKTKESELWANRVVENIPLRVHIWICQECHQHQLLLPGERRHTSRDQTMQPYMTLCCTLTKPPKWPLSRKCHYSSQLQLWDSVTMLEANEVAATTAASKSHQETKLQKTTFWCNTLNFCTKNQSTSSLCYLNCKHHGKEMVGSQAQERHFLGTTAVPS